MTRLHALLSLTLLPLFAATAPLAAAYVPGGDGVCTPEEEMDGLCFVSPSGFVVEAVTGPNGEFPVLDGAGDSVFSYQITGPGTGGNSCQGIADVSHADLLIPSCANGALEILSSNPMGQILSGGEGDASCGFGVGDLEHDVFKWDQEVSCDGSAVFSLVVAGNVSAEPTSFLLKAANDCDVATILGPSCPGPFNYCEGGVNSTGNSGHIDWDGTISISENNFFLTGEGLPADQPGFFFFGTEQVQMPFGDGQRCIGGDVTRLQKIEIEVNGTTAIQFDFTVPPLTTILPGVPYYFQLYYRDPAGGGAGFNTTDALCIVFAP